MSRMVAAIFCALFLGGAMLLASAGAASAQAAPCAGLALHRLRAAAAPITNAEGAILASVARLDRAVLGVRRCQGTKYVIMWGDGGAGEAFVERSLVEPRLRGLRAGDNILIASNKSRRVTAAEAQALMAAWLPPAAGAAASKSCESASNTRRSADEGLFGAMGLDAACPPAQPAPR